MNVQQSEFPVVLLAAGKGARAGKSKGLILVKNKTWIEHQVQALTENGITNVIVVVNDSDLAEYKHDVPLLFDRAYLTTQGFSVEVVINQQAERGVFSSLVCGLKRVLMDGVRGVFILPVDVPVPEASVWSLLQKSLSADVQACIPRCGDRGGHPVLISAFFAQRLADIPWSDPSARLDHQLKNLPENQKKFISVSDSRVLSNLNQREDFISFERAMK